METYPEVHAYSIGLLKRLLAESFEVSSHIIEKKSHTVYFESYFGAIGAKTTVVEKPYVDRDFLEDYSGYYVRCFHEYKRTCVRLHFFDIAFSKAALDTFFGGEKGELTAKSLQDSYLGFVVVKPLPETVIGRTCLKTYNSDDGRRNFPIVRHYEANLCGMPLSIETLAFQEQDRVAAACATSALWSVFQGTGKLFHHHIPSPVEITQAATEYWGTKTRVFPNYGLTPEQMAYAIRKVGLEPLLVSAKDKFLLQATLYAYLSGHVPVLMGVSLKDYSSDSPECMGGHAVVVSGYSLEKVSSQSYHKDGILLRSSRIDKIYAHDDQVGPFARMELCHGFMSTSWKGKDGKSGSVRAVPEVLIIPLYHKIRIPLETVLGIVMDFDALVEQLRPAIPLILPERVEWNVRLTTVNEFKAEMFDPDVDDLSADYKRSLLKRPLPRFLWRATAQSGASRLLDLLFDATDIEQGHFLSLAVEYNAGIGAALETLSNHPAVRENLAGHPVWRILEWFSS